MSPKGESQLDRTLLALADPTRRAILERLTRGDARVTEISEPFEMSLNAVSKHLQVLERAGLIKREVKGRDHWLSFEGSPLSEASEWIDNYRRFWEQRLESLDQFLRKKYHSRERKPKL
ncbi:MAG TPA: metalloregulator ArsR/SmtB family transcription factor [Terriglobia bacterium]|nr:metalloregulator ArsR/SmtB family transcription factor [Terriglobia bacterium]